MTLVRSNTASTRVLIIQNTLMITDRARST
jgi:hypothetical protein